MKTAAWITLIYAIIILAGGIVGDIKAASTASLIAGVLFGGLTLFTSIGMFKDSLLSAYFSILLMLFLDSFFTYRWLYTFHFFPAGLMSLISTLALIVVVLLLRKHLKQTNVH